MSAGKREEVLERNALKRKVRGLLESGASSTMKIAVTVHNAVRHDARVIKQAQTLKSAGHDVRVFGLTAERDEEFLLDGGIPVRLTHRDLSGAASFLSERGLESTRENAVWASFNEQGRLVFEAVRQTMRPDAVHIHDHVSLTAAKLYNEAFAVPIVWDAHEIYEELAGLEDVRRKVNPRIIKDNAPFVSAFITLNESIARVYAERYPELPHPTLIPNATRFSAVPSYDGRLHHAAGLSRDQRILLFQGGFADHRGISTLLDVASELNDKWSVVFMGWGKLEASIKERASELGDRPSTKARISVVPGAPHSELPVWTAGATLGAIPYEDIGLNHRYCTPNKLWEFPASGVPILATDLPEMAWRIREANMGLTVSPQMAAPGIANSINNLSEQDLRLFRVGALKFIERDSWARYEPKLLELYGNVSRRRNVFSRFFRVFGRRR
ncbi:putative glycosyl transferase [Brevibacterium casei]|uniref:Putative glycosyl transferase n=2 Tax=Brevibacterium casei TaxID=33889 RepID=A0A449DAX4_9MICO|nr:putative glycosyl transferase [Brevibacterium casei]